MKLRIKSTKLTLQIISWLQIIGGVTGLGQIAYLMLTTGTINGGILLIFQIGLGLFLFSIYSGKRLLSDENKMLGITLSIINQVPQIFQWKIFGSGITYSSGAELTIGIEMLSLKFNFSAIFSKFNMAIKSGDEVFIKLNLIAALIIFVLVDILKELKKLKEDRSIEIQEIQSNDLQN